MAKATADRQTQAIPVSLLRSFGVFGEDCFDHTAVPTKLAYKLVAEYCLVEAILW